MAHTISKDDIITLLSKELDFSEIIAKSAIEHVHKQLLNSLSVHEELTLTGFGPPITIKQTSKSQDSNLEINGEVTQSLLDKDLYNSIKKPKPGYEQRKLERRNFILDIEVINRDSGETLGNIGDITTEGVMIVSDYPLEAETMFKLKVTLPEEAGEKLEIPINATSIRCQKTIHENIYFTGFKLNTLSEENRLKIEYLIEEYAV